MALYDQLNSDLVNALRNHDEVAKNTLRGLKSALDTAVKNGATLSDELFLTTASSEIKRRKEAIAMYESGGSTERAAAEQAEIDLLMTYLPAQLSEAEIRTAVTQAVSDLGASSMNDMGKVMGQLKGQLGATADGATLAQIVKEVLS